jgi:DNA repair exonuclease SbcCD ATPase subunit
MIITELNTSPIKGQTFHEKLTEINMITGPNRAGKSAVAEAIAIGLYGHVPKLGESHAATFQVSTDPKQLFVELGFDEDGLRNFSVFKQEEGSISRSLNHSIKPPVVLLDARDFFKKTEQERMKEVTSKVADNLVSFEPGEFLKLIGKVEALPSEVAAPLRKEWTDRFKTALAQRVPMKQSVSVWLDGMLSVLKGRKRTLDESIKERQAVMKELKRDGPEPVDVHDELEQARQEAEQASNDLAVAQQAANDYERVNEKRESSKSTLAELPTSNTLIAKQAKVSSSIVKLKEQTTKKPAKIEPLAAKLSLARMEATKWITELGSIQAEKARLTTQAKEINQANKCPLCRCTGSGWKDAYSEWHSESLRDLKVRIAKAEALKEKAEENVAVWQNNCDLAQKLLNDHEDRITELTDLENQLEQINLQLNRRKELQETLAGLEVKAVDEKKLEALEKEHDKRRLKVIELQKAHEAFLDHKNNKELRETCETAYTTAFCELALVKGYLAVVSKEYERIVDDTFNTLLKTARLFSDGLLRGKLEYRNGELGYLRRDKAGCVMTWVPYKVFSGLEEMISFAGLSIALAQQSRIKLVIMDEMGRLTPDSKRAFMDRMIGLQHKRVLHQFIGIDVSVKDYGDFKRVINEIRVEEPSC